MGCKRNATDVMSTPPARSGAKRARAACSTPSSMPPSPEGSAVAPRRLHISGVRPSPLDTVAATLDSPVRATTPRRPPRMPRFDRDRNASADRSVVHRLHALSTPELVALVKDVEARYRQLAAFEAEEIRRAQRLGFVLGRTTPAMQTAW